MIDIKELLKDIPEYTPDPDPDADKRWVASQLVEKHGVEPDRAAALAERYGGTILSYLEYGGTWEHVDGLSRYRMGLLVGRLAQLRRVTPPQT